MGEEARAARSVARRHSGEKQERRCVERKAGRSERACLRHRARCSPMRERPHPYVWARGWRAWSVLSMSRFRSSSVIDPFLFHFPSPFAIVNSRALTSSAYTARNQVSSP